MPPRGQLFLWSWSLLDDVFLKKMNEKFSMSHMTEAQLLRRTRPEMRTVWSLHLEPMWTWCSQSSEKPCDSSIQLSEYTKVGSAGWFAALVGLRKQVGDVGGHWSIPLPGWSRSSCTVVKCLTQAQTLRGRSVPKKGDIIIIMREWLHSI